MSLTLYTIDGIGTLRCAEGGEMPGQTKDVQCQGPTPLSHIMVGGIRRGTVLKDDTDRDNFQKRLTGFRVAWATRPSHNYLVVLTLPSEYSLVAIS
jgi:hypothetical protein